MIAVYPVAVMEAFWVVVGILFIGIVVILWQEWQKNA